MLFGELVHEYAVLSSLRNCIQMFHCITVIDSLKHSLQLFFHLPNPFMQVVCVIYADGMFACKITLSKYWCNVSKLQLKFKRFRCYYAKPSNYSS